MAADPIYPASPVCSTLAFSVQQWPKPCLLQTALFPWTRRAALHNSHLLHKLSAPRRWHATCIRPSARPYLSDSIPTSAACLRPARVPSVIDHSALLSSTTYTFWASHGPFRLILKSLHHRPSARLRRRPTTQLCFCHLPPSSWSLFTSDNCYLSVHTCSAHPRLPPQHSSTPHSNSTITAVVIPLLCQQWPGARHGTHCMLLWIDQSLQ
jgi:hypothetical protein